MRKSWGVLLAAGMCLTGTVWGQTVNINTASPTALTQLDGIGPKKAKAIVDYRSANGPFGSVGDITEVKGIGPKTLAHDRAMMSVKAPGSHAGEANADSPNGQQAGQASSNGAGST